LEFRQDFYLEELQNHLHEFWDIDVSLSTIWHALQNAGLTWKKVAIFTHFPPVFMNHDFLTADKGHNRVQ
jgi:hypothetical protein